MKKNTYTLYIMHYITKVLQSIGLSNNTPINKNIKDNHLLSKPQFYKNISTSESMVVTPNK